ncbi:MAG TPA: hypothetical protein VG165_16420 [Solirubrobacteraceae bacterium]|jgi:hypothetical protein|nr:hypothetical protein [Solirubrobacteraceae bacterium]
MVLAAAYGVIVLAHFRGIVSFIYTNSDYAAPAVVAHAMGGAPAGTDFVIGQSKWYEPLSFLRVTEWLPLHRQFWDLLPLLGDLAAVGLLVASARRAFGVWGAALTAAALACVGEAGLLALLTLDSHAAAVVHAVVLGAALVWLAAHNEALSWRRLAAACIALGLVSSLAVPDSLFVIWGLIPLVATAVLCAWRQGGRRSTQLLAFALGTAAVALVAGRVFAQELTHDGVGAASFPLSFASGEAVVAHVTLMAQSLTGLAGGDFFGLPVDFASLATFATGALVLTALVVVLADVRHRVSVAGPRRRVDHGRVTPRFVYVAFWSSCLISALATFTFGTAGGNLGGGRYLLGAYVAVAALLPLVAERGVGFKLSVAVGVSLLAIIATYQLVRVPVDPQGSSLNTRTANAVAGFARAHHLKYGYAGYWDSLPISWATDFGVQVFPVAQCEPGQATLCPFSIVHVSSWYVPRPATPTFLIVDPTVPFPVSSRDPALGTPVLSARFDRLEVYVYPYDIASRLGGRYAP